MKEEVQEVALLSNTVLVGIVQVTGDLVHVGISCH